MKLTYREHRGSLEESLKTAKEYSDLKDLFQDVAKQYMLKKEQVYLSYYCYDSRIDWETFAVGIEMKGYNTPQCVGFVKFNNREE